MYFPPTIEEKRTLHHVFDAGYGPDDRSYIDSFEDVLYESMAKYSDRAIMLEKEEEDEMEKIIIKVIQQ